MSINKGNDSLSDLGLSGGGFVSTIEKHGLHITPLSIRTMQVNITRQCNQSCIHCHVDASPRRTESMSLDTMEKCLETLSAHDEIEILDITGGAPELHPAFCGMVLRARLLKKKVMVRHNLTILFEEKYLKSDYAVDLPKFFAQNQVEIIASLPYYQEYFTDRQRGKGVFNKSIAAIKLLNDAGYGKDERLILNLVYNPPGAFLPAGQDALEKDFKRELSQHHGLTFNHLYTITNMPVNRFRNQLEQAGIYEDYLGKLKGSFNPAAAENVMCRSQVSIGYDGTLYDCDFNQMLGLQCVQEEPATIFNFNYDRFLERRIIFGNHCYGCLAGAGSSCGGTTT
jgi:radical SAM/Cys-rich protein